MNIVTIKSGTMVLPAVRVYDKSGMDIDKCVKPVYVDKSPAISWVKKNTVVDWEIDLDDRFLVLFNGIAGQKFTYYFFSIDGDFGFIVKSEEFEIYN